MNELFSGRFCFFELFVWNFGLMINLPLYNDSLGKACVCDIGEAEERPIYVSNSQGQK